MIKNIQLARAKINALNLLKTVKVFIDTSKTGMLELSFQIGCE